MRIEEMINRVLFGGKLSLFGLSDYSGEHSVHCFESTKRELILRQKFRNGKG